MAKRFLVLFFLYIFCLNSYADYYCINKTDRVSKNIVNAVYILQCFGYGIPKSIFDIDKSKIFEDILNVSYKSKVGVEEIVTFDSQTKVTIIGGSSHCDSIAMDLLSTDFAGAKIQCGNIKTKRKKRKIKKKKIKWIVSQRRWKFLPLLTITTRQLLKRLFFFCITPKIIYI